MTQGTTITNIPALRPAYQSRNGLFQIIRFSIENILNNIFALTHNAGQIRSGLFLIIGIGVWTILAFRNEKFDDWSVLILNLVPGIAPPESSLLNNLWNIIWRLVTTFFAPDMIGLLIIIYIPFRLAYSIGAIYLADIFEQEEAISRKFLGQVAFADSAYDTLRVEDAKVNLQDQRLPLFRIGGPGKVKVNLENVAIFEKPNGDTEVIGPTVFEPGERKTIQGFERFRQAIDLRDQTMILEGISGRTKDGIQIRLENVRLLYSVIRGDQVPSLEQPYPFDPQGIYWLVYSQAADQPLIASISNLVRTEFIKFIGEHRLSELLTSISEPEIKRQKELNWIIQKQIWRNQRYRKHSTLMDHALQYGYWKNSWPSNIRPQKQKHIKKKHYFRIFQRLTYPLYTPPASVTRGTIRDIFSNRGRFYADFIKSFPGRAAQQGVNLSWIDVGTWQIPNNIISGQYQEAWKITNDNQMRSSPRALDDLRNMTKARELAKLIQSNLLTFRKLIQEYQSDKDELIYKLIHEYQSYLRKTLEFYSHEKRHVPERLRLSLQYIHEFQTRDYQERRKGVYLN